MKQSIFRIPLNHNANAGMSKHICASEFRVLRVFAARTSENTIIVEPQSLVVFQFYGQLKRIELNLKGM